MDDVNRLQRDDKGIMNAYKLIRRQLFLQSFQPLKADDLLIFHMDRDIIL
jgi:hypothetical protein